MRSLIASAAATSAGSSSSTRKIEVEVAVADVAEQAHRCAPGSARSAFVSAMHSASRDTGTQTSVVIGLAPGRSAHAAKKALCRAAQRRLRSAWSVDHSKSRAPCPSAMARTASASSATPRSRAVELEAHGRGHGEVQAGVAVHGVDLRLVEQLGAGDRDAELHELDHGADGGVDRREGGHGGRHRLRDAVDPERELADDAERALAAGEQAGEVVARRALAGPARRADHRAVGSDDREVHDVVAHASRSGRSWCPTPGWRPCRRGWRRPPGPPGRTARRGRAPR